MFDFRKLQDSNFELKVRKMGDVYTEQQLFNGFYVQQNWEGAEALVSCYEQKNTYEVSNYTNNSRNKGNHYFDAEETTSLCPRLCCGENRPFFFKLISNAQDKVALTFSRSYRVCGCAAIPGCAHKVNISDDNGDKKAQVRVPFCGGFIWPTYNLEEIDENGNVKLMGYVTRDALCPCCICDFCGVSFDIKNEQGQPVGKLHKLAPANIREALLECYTEADRYKVDFRAVQPKEDWEKPIDLSENFKNAVLASVFQIDFNFFEDHRGPCEGHCCDVYCCGYAVPCLPCCFLGACGALLGMCGCECRCCSGATKKKPLTSPGGAPEIAAMEI